MTYHLKVDLYLKKGYNITCMDSFAITNRLAEKCGVQLVKTS